MSDNFTYLVDDDFLPEGMVQEIHDTLLNSDAEWVLGRQLLSDDYRFKTNIDPYVGSQFNHLFFIDSRKLYVLFYIYYSIKNNYNKLIFHFNFQFRASKKMYEADFVLLN